MKRYLTQSEINHIAGELSERASDGRAPDVVSNKMGTYFEPARDAAEDLYSVSLNNSQVRYISKLAQIGYRGIIEQVKRGLS